MFVHAGDEVMITVGKDKGQKGKVEKVLSKKNMVLIPGLNVYKKHAKAGLRSNQGGIIDVNKPINISNLLLVCPKCHLSTRVGNDTKEKGKRICKKCQNIF